MMKHTTDLMTEYEAVLYSWWNRSHIIPHNYINHKKYIRMVTEFVSDNDNKEILIIGGPKDIGKTIFLNVGYYVFNVDLKLM